MSVQQLTLDGHLLHGLNSYSKKILFLTWPAFRWRDWRGRVYLGTTNRPELEMFEAGGWLVARGVVVDLVAGVLPRPPQRLDCRYPPERPIGLFHSPFRAHFAVDRAPDWVGRGLWLLLADYWVADC